jgi:hypothetical protein
MFGQTALDPSAAQPNEFFSQHGTSQDIVARQSDAGTSGEHEVTPDEASAALAWIDRS